MTISSAICRNDYTGTGATATYPYAFRILQSSDLLVIQTDTSGVETTLVLGTDYSVTGVGSYSGGNVVLSANLASGYGLAIKRVVPLTQPTSIRNQASFLPSVHEDVFDRLTMIDQQQQDAIDRSLSLPEGSVGIDASIPALIPNYSLVANAAGDGFDFAPNTAADQLADLADTTDAAKGSGRIGFNYALSYAAGTIGAWLKGLADGTGASLLGYLSPLTGAVAQTVQDKLGEIVSVEDFGAVGDGLTDDTAALSSALAAYSTLRLTPGKTYLIAGATVPGGRAIIGEGAALKLKALGSGVYTPMLNVTGPDVSITGVTFDGNRANQPADGFSDSYDGGAGGKGRAARCAIKADNLGGGTAANLSVIGCVFHDVWGGSIATRGVSGVLIDGNRFYSCNFEGAFIYGDGTNRNTGVIVTKNSFTDMGSGDASVNANACILSSCDGAIFSGNIAKNVERNILKMEACNQSTASNNTLDGNVIVDFNGLQMQAGGIGNSFINNKILNTNGGIQVYSGVYSDISIIGNTVKQIDPIVGASAPDAIQAFGIDGLIISGNNIRNAGRHGINMRDLSNVSVSQNIIRQSPSALAGSGIYVAATNQAMSTLDISNNDIGAFNASTGDGTVAVVCSTYAISDLRITDNAVSTTAGDATGRGLRFTSATNLSGLSIVGNRVLGNCEGHPAGTVLSRNNILRIIGNLPPMGNIRGAGSAAPTSGSYYVGDTWMNTGVAAGAPIGWTCVTQGTPGAWQPFGIIGGLAPLASTAAAPAGTASATAVMMGLGGAAAYTPKTSSKLLITASFQAANSTVNDGITCDLRFGTGTAPTNGAAPQGTVVGIAQTRTSLVAGDRAGMTLQGIATVTPGTPYWIDVSALAVTGGTASITGVSIVAHEV